MFLHANLTHIFFNMFALWMFGVVVENVWGPKKFLFYYISCGIGAGIMQEIVQLFDFYFRISAQDPSIGFSELFVIGQQLSNQLNGWTTIGASGAVYAILLAFGMIFPNERIFIFPLPIPIKAKWFVCGYAAIELFSAISSSADGVAHMAHLGGMLFGFLMIRYWNRHLDSSFNRSNGQEFFDNLKRNFEKRRNNNSNMHAEQGGTKEDDWAYNSRKKQNQEEIDAILDKIRKSGYDSLTKEEKQKLFDASRNS
jgi:membrane associated rhomboid family serine protease